MGIDGGEPDDLLLAKATIDVPAESAAEVYHPDLLITCGHSKKLAQMLVSDYHESMIRQVNRRASFLLDSW